MTQPATIDQLFDNDRLPQELLSWLVILLYFPIGLILMIVRLFIGFHVYLVAGLLSKTSLIRQVIMRMMCGVLGIIVVQSNCRNSQRVHVLVSNFTTTLDHVAVELVVPNVMPSLWDLPSFLIWLLGYRDMGAKHGRDSLIQNALKHCQESEIPLLAFAEGATTNGKVGLLKFGVWPFSLDQTVQPIAIRVKRPPFFNIAPCVLNGRWWSDLLWFLFLPYSLFQIRYLPLMSQTEEETSQEFAKRVQVAIAKTLTIEPTSFTSSDKLEFIKRHMFLQQHSQVSNASSSVTSPSQRKPTETDIMVDQVKVVLPHVPLNIIRKDLEMTKDIDLTITNILEGRVANFNPEEPSVEADRATSPKPIHSISVNYILIHFIDRPTIDRMLNRNEHDKTSII